MFLTKTEDGEYLVHIEDRGMGWGRKLGTFPTRKDAVSFIQSYVAQNQKEPTT